MDRRSVAAKLFIEKIACFNSPGFVKTLSDQQVTAFAQEAQKQASIFTQEWHKLRQKEDEARQARAEERKRQQEMNYFMADSAHSVVNFLDEIQPECELDPEFVADKLSD